MPFCILLYSSDPVRGRILEKAFGIARLESVRCATARALRAELNRRIHDVVIIDTKGGFWNEEQKVTACCRILKKSVTIILADRQELPALRTAGLRYDVLLPEPFDPEQAVAVARQLSDDKKKTPRAACWKGLSRPVPGHSVFSSEPSPC